MGEQCTQQDVVFISLLYCKFIVCLGEVSLSLCIPAYYLQDEDTESESEDECIKNTLYE